MQSGACPSTAAPLHMCSAQTCLNTAGGYDCACLPGYLAPPDASHSCRVAEGRVNLVIGRGREIRSGAN